MLPFQVDEPALSVAVDDTGEEVITTSNYQTVIVPDFIMRAMALHKVNVIDIQNFDIMSKVCSTDDLALWNAIADSSYKDVRFSNNLFRFFKDAVWSKFSTVDTLSYSEEIKNSAKTYSDASDSEEPFHYELKSIGSAILVVVQPGFLFHLNKSNETAVDFFRQLIKACEQVSSPHEVAQLHFFKTFLKLTTSFVS